MKVMKILENFTMNANDTKREISCFKEGFYSRALGFASLNVELETCSFGRFMVDPWPVTLGRTKLSSC